VELDAPPGGMGERNEPAIRTVSGWKALRRHVMAATGKKLMRMDTQSVLATWKWKHQRPVTVDYVRDDSAGRDQTPRPVVVSPTHQERKGEHPGTLEQVQGHDTADAYAGFEQISTKWSHSGAGLLGDVRRKFYEYPGRPKVSGRQQKKHLDNASGHFMPVERRHHGRFA